MFEVRYSSRVRQSKTTRDVSRTFSARLGDLTGLLDRIGNAFGWITGLFHRKPERPPLPPD